MKILSATQIRELDAFTIQNEPITSIKLMERAAKAFTHWFVDKFQDEGRQIYVFCGPGNNGGDGLAVARLLYERFYTVKVIICSIGSNTSRDFNHNFESLPQKIAADKIILSKADKLPSLKANSIIIDAIFGSGLSRSIEGYWAKVVNHLNDSNCTIVAIDIPSGLFADKHSAGSIIKADFTLSFQLPKLAFLFPENQHFVGQWFIKSIGLSTDFIQKEKTAFHFTTKEKAALLLRKRNKFDHKGDYGHALLIAGSYGKMGAASLAAKACLRSGVGLLSVQIPQKGYDIIQISTPEAMAIIDTDAYCFSECPDMAKYTAIGIGCGLGTATKSKAAFLQLIEQADKPLVIDADALNLLAQNKDYLKKLPENSILTPHVGEFRRLFGESTDEFERNKLQSKKAKNLGLIIILKGANTCIADSDGQCHFNSTGNQGMATAGSGDVLTGIITALLAQSYAPCEAAILGVFLHGMAGDIGADKIGQTSLLASDIITNLGTAFHTLKNENDKKI